MREIVFDTETTGLDPLQGDRLVEIGCIELVNRFPTGRSFHCYFNPERDMPESAREIHGLTVEFLKDNPRFAERAEEINIERAEAAKARAEKRLASNDPDLDWDRATIALQRSLLRIQVAHKHHAPAATGR